MRKITKITCLKQYSSFSLHHKDVHGSLWVHDPFSTTSLDDDSQIKDRKLKLGFKDASKMICVLRDGSKRVRVHECEYFTPCSGQGYPG